MNSGNDQFFSTLVNLDMTALASAKEGEKRKYATRLHFRARSLLEKSSGEALPIVLMQEIISFSRRHSDLVPYIEPTFWDIFEKAKASKNPFIYTQAQNKLISFFSFEAPYTLAQKRAFLSELSHKEDIVANYKVMPKILQKIIAHYIGTSQYKQDSDSSVVHLSAGILNQLSGKEKHSIMNNQVRLGLRNVVANLRTVAPQIAAPYLKKWRSAFKPFVPRIETTIKKTLYDRLAESPQAFSLLKTKRAIIKD